MWELHSASSYKLSLGVRADISVPTRGCLCLFLLAFFRFRSQPGARRAHKSGSRTGRLRLAVGAQEAGARLCLCSTLVHAGPTLASGLAFPRHLCLLYPRHPAQPAHHNLRDQTQPRSLSQQQPSAQKMSLALKMTRHPWSVHLESSPKLFLVV